MVLALPAASVRWHQSRLLLAALLLVLACSCGSATTSARSQDASVTPVVPTLGNGLGGQGKVTINGELTVRGKATVQSLTSTGLSVIGNAQVQGLLSCASASAKSLSTQTIQTGSIMSPSGTLVIQGNLALSNPTQTANPTTPTPLNPTAQAVALIAESVVLSGVKQWQLVEHDDFDNGSQGWSNAGTSTCSGKDRMLGGYCELASGPTVKTFDSLPPHSHLRITARVNYIDQWTGQTAFMKIDDQIVWLNSLDTRPSPNSAEPMGINVCGSSYPEQKLSDPIDIAIPHDSSVAVLSFGASFGPMQDPCLASLGIDDVMIFVR